MNTPRQPQAMLGAGTGGFTVKNGGVKKGVQPEKPLISGTFRAGRPVLCCIKITKKIELILANPNLGFHLSGRFRITQPTEIFVVFRGNESENNAKNS
ncbi:MAG: hypothetical protein IKS55_04730 [Oscillospiraceae bacterium]|nr:hypothetical protein [Oscillospiraceae bacterium]